VLPAGGYGGYRVCAWKARGTCADRDGKVAVARVTVAKLSLSVATPAVDPSFLRQGERVIRPRRDGRDGVIARQTRDAYSHRNWRFTVRRRAAGAQLSMRVPMHIPCHCALAPG
jgi:hypothetical protein